MMQHKFISSGKMHPNESRLDDDFMQGILDCEKGIEHKSNMSEMYNEGYRQAYSQMQIDDANCNQIWQKPQIRDLSFAEGREKFQRAKELNDVKE